MKITKMIHAIALLVATTLPLAAASITTTFADNNRFTGNMFNLTTLGSSITVNGLDVNVDSGAVTIDVYIKTGTYVGFDTNAAAWTLVSTTVVTGKGAGSQTAVNVTPFTLAANTLYGVYVTTTNPNDSTPFMYYTNGSNTYSNSNLTLSTGEGLGGLFGSISVEPGRTWDGTIDYSLPTTTLPEPSSLGLLALGAPAFLLLRRRYFRKY